jgi:ribosomal protein S1
VKAIVIKVSDHGVLVSVEEGIYGLVHISEFKDFDELKDMYKLGEIYNFKIKVFDVGEEKMILKPTDK